jgi:DNA-binding transcriptional ArsR family regulator
VPRITGINCMRQRPVCPPSSACGTLLKIKGMLISMAADLMSMNSDSSGSATTGMPTPIYPLQEAGKDQAASHGSNDGWLLEIKDVDQQDVSFLDDHIFRSGFRAGPQRRQSRYINGLVSQLSRANSSTDAELFSIDMLPVSAIGLWMVAAANLVEVAALVGDTARATILNALMGGQSLTATELAYCANVSRSTASGHLSKLVAARLLTVTHKRRFSYYRIASPLVATMLESIKVVAAIEVPPRRQPRSASDDALRFARSCYDHLAGQVGVAVTDALVAMGHIVLTDEGGEVTSSGARFLSAFGADLTPRTRRIFCQPCLDWSERRYHLKGLVGARILDRLLELAWLKCVSGSRALQLTSSGRAGLSEIFQIEFNSEGVPTGRLCDPRRLTA